jgi:hypothetical protein
MLQTLHPLRNISDQTKIGWDAVDIISAQERNLVGGSRDGEILAFSEIENLMALGHPVF